ALKGPADRLMRELGHEDSVVGVARLYAPFAGALVIDEQDAQHAGAVEDAGLRCIVTDTIMRDPDAAAALCRAALGGGLRRNLQRRTSTTTGRGKVPVTARGLQIIPVEGIGEVRPGADLSRLLAAAAPDLADGDVVVVTQKVVSKAEAQLVPIDPGDPVSKVR